MSVANEAINRIIAGFSSRGEATTERVKRKNPKYAILSFSLAFMWNTTFSRFIFHKEDWAWSFVGNFVADASEEEFGD